MLNNTKNTFNGNLTFNSVSGLLVKSHNHSKFMRFHSNSDRAKLVFCINKPRLKIKTGT